ncbi:MAG: DUF6636 domain-containing protein [Thermoleophilia bacterium]
MRHTAFAIAGLAAATLVPATALAAPPTNFRTPSGNIGCDMRPNEVRCDVLQHTYTAPPKPASCDFDWGGAFVVRKHGRGRPVCYSDTVVPPPGRKHTVGYGTSVYRNGFRCTVARTGVTCTNADAHGFAVSRQAFRLF